MEPLGLAASLITIAATCKVAYRFGRKIKNAPREVRRQSRQLLKHSENIKRIAQGLDDSTIIVSGETLRRIRADLKSAERLLAEFHERTAFLRIGSISATVKLGFIKGILCFIKQLCRILKLCLFDTKKLVHQMKKLAKHASKLAFNERIKHLEENSIRYDENNKLSEEFNIQSDENRRRYEESSSQSEEDTTQVEEKSKERPTKTTQDRISNQETRCCESNQNWGTVGGAVAGAVVGGYIGFRFGGSWGAVAGVVVGDLW
ncbi:hypothetical protein BGZ61DRAFT_588471 [Ilyonectria robusta]|uniref:uncharacterized protein n=1 Tax=Ilyonectria robusta TaxID=1079257 RepID=UPI001E8EB8C1|nr:uncharacterized protein BGZ61DRAFT_588471 [Ilyonectria robusta]KAH8694512.1 hypothetical protein BGZ61DRAFT_588471 [Ilyonectria robusta]